MTTTNQPRTKELRSMHRVLSDQLRRLNELAPADTFDKKSDSDGYALTWRNTIRFVGDATACLDDLAGNYEDEPPQDAKAEQPTEADASGVRREVVASLSKPQGRSPRRASPKSVKSA